MVTNLLKEKIHSINVFKLEILCNSTYSDKLKEVHHPSCRREFHCWLNILELNNKNIKKISFKHLELIRPVFLYIVNYLKLWIIRKCCRLLFIGYNFSTQREEKSLPWIYPSSGPIYALRRIYEILTLTNDFRFFRPGVKMIYC